MLPEGSAFKPYFLTELNFCLESQSLTGNRGILQGLESHLEAFEVYEVRSYLH